MASLNKMKMELFGSGNFSSPSGNGSMDEIKNVKRDEMLNKHQMYENVQEEGLESEPEAFQEEGINLSIDELGLVPDKMEIEQPSIANNIIDDGAEEIKRKMEMATQERLKKIEEEAEQARIAELQRLEEEKEKRLLEEQLEAERLEVERIEAEKQKQQLKEQQKRAQQEMKQQQQTATKRGRQPRKAKNNMEIDFETMLALRLVEKAQKEGVALQDFSQEDVDRIWELIKDRIANS